MPIDAQDYRELVRQVAYEQAQLSSSSWFFTGEDRLRLTTFGSLASIVVSVEWRILDSAGRIVAAARPHTPNSDRTSATTLIDLGEGFLLNVQLRATTGAPRRGQVYAMLEVVRGLGATVQPLGVLWEGYVTDTTPAGWPGSPAASSVDGVGVIRSITGTDPAAGAEISETVPTNARWRFLSAILTLVTDATAANRVVRALCDDGTTAFTRGDSNFNQTASTTVLYNVGQLGTFGSEGGNTIGIMLSGPLTLMGGFRLATLTVSLQAGDNYGAPQLLVEEWIED